MFNFPLRFLSGRLGLVLLMGVAGCAGDKGMNFTRQSYVELLAREMREDTGWAQVHALEALLDHQQTMLVDAVLVSAGEDETNKYRIGVWRVMARAAATESARLNYVERIRKVALNPAAPDRLQAIESLCKLNVTNPADRAAIESWRDEADEATAAFPCWFLALTSSPAQRPQAEQRLAKLLDSPDAIARLRAAYAIGRLEKPAPTTRERLNRQLAIEPADSVARVFVLVAALRHTGDDATKSRLCDALIPFAQRGQPGEQQAAAIALGQAGRAKDFKILSALLTHPEAEARIGAAGGLLYFSR